MPTPDVRVNYSEFSDEGQECAPILTVPWRLPNGENAATSGVPVLQFVLTLPANEADIQFQSSAALVALVECI